ncbi:hypothetical protein IQ254_04705 [Nodosilinea sp. LEGE 07088]|uniref:hypothetical protein n=1 Tax=Nodosilinea sp. LEGE 07088 TaxID=2777968 RepID=UPI001882F1C6|nr:hypothetical protein [Nodosilinea sp. LEGE 07088]MBE9136504.1 hypothetical protein [Nodosilinea sp. LEGE 07088]
MFLIAIRLLHTAVVVVMVTAILFLLYCGWANDLSRWTAIAFATVSVEVVIYVGNGWRCPLRTLAETLTPAGQTVQDIYLPSWLAARIVGVSTPLLGIACVLLLARLLLNGGPD